MACRADLEVDVRLGQTELAEEDLGHPLVVVLPCVNDRLLGVAERRDHRRRLDEVRPRTKNMHDGLEHNFPSVHRSRLRSPAVLETTRHRAKLIVYPAGLAWRQLRDDPRRAGRLALRLALRHAPARLSRPRLGALTKPRPRDPRREAADLRALLAREPREPLHDHDGGAGSTGVIMQRFT